MEDAFDGVKAYFDASLSAALAVIEAARTVVIPRPYEIVTAYSKAKQFPNISIVPATTAFEYGENDAFLNPWNDHDVAILIAHAGAVQRDVQTTLVRYVEAIEAISTGSKTNYQYNGRFEVVQLVEVEYSLVLANEEKSTIQVTGIEMLVRELQT